MALLRGALAALCLWSLREVVAEQSSDRTITQVVKLLQTMMEKSKAEGNSERDLFAKHKCYCDQNEVEKKSTIEGKTRQIGLLESEIDKIQASSQELSVEVAHLNKSMAENQQAQQEADEARNQEEADFLLLQTDLDTAMNQTTEAIQQLAEVGADQNLRSAEDHKQFMAGHNVSVANLKISVKQALLAASAFVRGSHVAAVDAFLQQSPFTGTYSSQSGEVFGILKNMRATFKANLAAAQEKEQRAVEAHGKFIQAMQEAMQKMEQQHTKKQGLLSGNDSELASKKLQLRDAQQDLEDAETFLASLLDLCALKKKQYQNRVTLRSREETVIAEAIAILNSDAAFATFGTVEATRDQTPLASFLQQRAIHEHRGSPSSAAGAKRQTAQAFLQRAAGAQDSPLLSRLVSMLQGGNPFSVVLAEIDRMIGLIADEEQADQEQKSWCDSERLEKDASIDRMNTEIGTLDTQISQLIGDISNPVTGLQKQISDNEDQWQQNHANQVSGTSERKTENMEYQKNVANLVETEALLTKATGILERYYAKISAMQAGLLQRRQDPAPPPTWEGEFKGQSENGNSAVQMLQLILTNTKTEEMQAHTDEMTAQHEYEDSMEALKTEQDQLQRASVSLKETLAKKEVELQEKKKNLKATVKTKAAAEAYLLDIKPGCDFITTNLAMRQGHRTTETTALTEAIRLLKDSPVYMTHVEIAHNESLGDCLSICAGNEGHVRCKACLAETSVPGFCAGHPTTLGC